MSSTSNEASVNVHVSIAIFAWNEEKVIGPALERLFQQTLFGELQSRGLSTEIICVVNGCEDRTPEVARQVFERQAQRHPNRASLICQVANLAERGKLNAWNQFVHSLSSDRACFLIMMDADISIGDPETLASMVATLENDPQATVAVDRPVKAFTAREGKWRRKLSLDAARVTQSAPAQLCAQLYCIRAEVARNIYLPRHLSACEDGFIKSVVCTDFLTQPVNPRRIQVADRATHSFEAYTSPLAILKNQKRQIIGQTIVHILVDQYLSGLPAGQRLALRETFTRNETQDPVWLKRLIDAHLRRVRFFWRLYPGLLSTRIRRLATLKPKERLACLPAAMMSLGVTVVSSFMAYRFLRAGSTDYWPRAERSGPNGQATPASLGLEHSIEHPR